MGYLKVEQINNQEAGQVQAGVYEREKRPKEIGLRYARFRGASYWPDLLRFLAMVTQ